jgi:DNA-binding NarL/FixJ family response regulator
MKPIKLALVDDHKLFRKGMVELLGDFDGYQVIIEANNGRELTELLKTDALPDIVLLDINMPEMDGYDTAEWLKKHFPSVKVLALSMYDTEEMVIRMLRAGAKGYILKDAEPAELRNALEMLTLKGVYFSEWVSSTLLNSIHKLEETGKKAGELNLNIREIEFLKWVSTELTYKEIADKMCLSVRTVDGYRETLFEKLQVKSRTGLVLYAIKKGVINV